VRLAGDEVEERLAPGAPRGVDLAFAGWVFAILFGFFA